MCGLSRAKNRTNGDAYPKIGESGKNRSVPKNRMSVTQYLDGIPKRGYGL